MQEVAPQHTIYHTVIVRKRQVHFMTDGNCISFRCLYDSRFLLNVSHSQDSYLRLIYDRCAEKALKLVIVNVPPSISSGINLLSRALIANESMATANPLRFK